MKVMGMSSFTDWVAHFFVNYSKMLITVVVSTILMTFLTKGTHFTIVLLFFALYAFAATSYSLAISTFVNSGTSGVLLAVIGWIMLFFWSSFITSIDVQRPYSYSVKLMNCLNPNIALSFGLQLVGQYETQGKAF